LTPSRQVRPAGVPVQARVAMPGSKSLTIRALAAAALGRGRSHLYGALRSEDTAAMTRCLAGLGISLQVEVEPWAVDGAAGDLAPIAEVIDVNESALSARILIAMSALGRGELTIDGQGSLRRRPMDGLLEALAAWGVETHSAGTVPVTVSGRGGVPGGPVSVDATKTSQFATALLLVAPLAERATELRIDRLVGSRGYLELTVSVMRDFGAAVTPTLTGYVVEPGGYDASDYVVEPDASAAVYPMLAAAITGGEVELDGLTSDSHQPDMAVAGVFAEMGCEVRAGESGLLIRGPEGRLRPYHGDLGAIPDGALAVAVACLFADGPSVIGGMGSLRHKESDRLRALKEGIDRLGAFAKIRGDSLLIGPGELTPAVIDSHGDHRIAMSFGTAGLAVAGIRISQPEVVAKTWPGFWDMLEDLTG
jgi:3-phosphoshikimate 1-carboxyvinyltransferase